MLLGGQDFSFQDTYDSIITVPDCYVCNANKIGAGNGEAKLYIGSKPAMHAFFGDEGFSAECFLLKSDLISYLNAMRDEYFQPSFEYRKKDNLPSLWNQRLQLVNSLPDIIEFTVSDQKQIEGIRGYVNSDDQGYELVRQLSLPWVTYISAMKVLTPNGKIKFYWKLFVDFDYLAKSQPYALVYGKKDAKEEKSVEIVEPKKKNIGRVGQDKYREKLLAECPFCPITMINDERLLIASHIKPWAVSNDDEKIDPKNGFMLSPLYDRLFDQGFITFTDDRKMLVSHWLSPNNVKRLELKNEKVFPRLPIDGRIKYLDYHHQFVFKG